MMILNKLEILELEFFKDLHEFYTKWIQDHQKDIKLCKDGKKIFLELERKIQCQINKKNEF